MTATAIAAQAEVRIGKGLLAGYPLIYIQTADEARLAALLTRLAREHYGRADELVRWSCARGSDAINSGGSLKAGDIVTVTATYSESVTGTPTAPTLTVGSETGIVLTNGTTSGATRTWTYTIADTGTADSGALSLSGGSYLTGMADAAGNAVTGSAATASGSYTVDTTAPSFSTGATASFAENATTTAYGATADSDSGVTYTLGGTDAARFNINTSSGAVTFKSAPDYESPTDSGSNNDYDITVTATDAAGNATNQAVAITVTNVAESLAGQAEIDLGEYGKLINGVQVEGNWYYYWDRSGDGTNADRGSLNGGVDYTTHDVLDGLFRYASDFTTLDNDSNTDNTYRYATLNGVRVALPTHGEASVTTG